MDTYMLIIEKNYLQNSLKIHMATFYIKLFVDQIRRKTIIGITTKLFCSEGVLFIEVNKVSTQKYEK